MNQTPDSWNRPDELDDATAAAPFAASTATAAPDTSSSYGAHGRPDAPTDDSLPEAPTDHSLPEAPTDYGLPDASSDDSLPEAPTDYGLRGDGLSGEPQFRRGIRIRTVVLGLVLFAIAGSVLISQLTSISVDPFAIALALMIGAGLLLLIAGTRRTDRN